MQHVCSSDVTMPNKLWARIGPNPQNTQNMSKSIAFVRGLPNGLILFHRRLRLLQLLLHQHTEMNVNSVLAWPKKKYTKTQHVWPQPPLEHLKKKDPSKWQAIPGKHVFNQVKVYSRIFRQLKPKALRMVLVISTFGCACASALG